LVGIGLLAGVAGFAVAPSAGAAAPDVPAQPAAPEAGAQGQGQDQGAPEGEGGQGNGGGPVVPAPVPDPFLAEMVSTCRQALSGDSGTLQKMTDAGWGPVVDGATQTPFYQSFTGEKDYDGVGTVDITWSFEVYPTMTEGYCSISIETALRKIGIADLKNAADLTGQYRETDEGVASTWQDKGATPTTFIQADQHNSDLYFILDVTRLEQKPAADIPYVKPPVSPDDQDLEQPELDNPGGPDTTNAIN
jgi:hypothetical protein